MPRDYRLYLDDILDAVQQIRNYTEDLDYTAFLKRPENQDAVVRNLEVIGEASGNLPKEWQNQEPEIDWRKIKGLRNILIHEYSGINLPIVWDVVQTKLGGLEAVCQRLLEEAGESKAEV